MKRKNTSKIFLIASVSLVFSITLIVFILRSYHEKKNLKYIENANASSLARIGQGFGKKFPNIQLTDTAGKRVYLNDYKDKILYLDFSSLHCGPCIEQEIYWDKLVERFSGDTGIAFINVDIDRDFNEWKQALSMKKPKGVSLSYKSSNVSSGKEFGVNQFPTYFF